MRSGIVRRIRDVASLYPSVNTQARSFCSAVVPSAAESPLGPEYSFLKESEGMKIPVELYEFPIVSTLREIRSSPVKLPMNDAIHSVFSRALSVSFDSAGAIYLLHCLSNISQGSGDALLETVVKRVEEQYFALDSDWLSPRSPFARLLVEAGYVDPSSRPSFKSVVHQLPPRCKALIMGAHISRPSKRIPSAKTKEEIEARWHSMDPVDMETVERDHFLATKQVLRTRQVEAVPSPMRAGSRLAQVLGMEFLESIPEMSVNDFVLFASCMLTAPKNGVFHRDLKHDAQFAICKRILQFSDEEVGEYVLPLSLVLAEFEANLEIPNRVWARKIVPVIRKGFGKVENVPEQYEGLNEVSRWALLSASVMSSGRVPVTNRLLSYLTPKLSKSAAEIDAGIAGQLMDALVIAGACDESLVLALSARSDSLSIDCLVKLIHARSHFGLFGSDFESLVDHLRLEIEKNAAQLNSWSRSDKLMLLNSLFASAAEPQSETVLALTKTVCARLPDFEIDSLGRIDSVLE